ncbi:hypothetical protein [Pedobacter cryoconitis]|uniref:Uncharacterized protein n=1 Tax=Pedobacter cryoconitis TaxID=188932 RepID=A0A7X0J6I5_9SPHI|nr:hypothetical protein [Pedobacter cryoconitis]MBB6502015.1 hypothetical protein [Pedobacter cryoconitis]
MKLKIIFVIISVIFLLAVFFFLKGKYDQYQWSKAIVTPEHRLQPGSFIFYQTSGMVTDGGSQSWQYKHDYDIKIVVRIDKDYVILAGVEQFSIENELAEDKFTSEAERYEKMKSRITGKIVTRISADDLYKQGGDGYTLTKYLKEKYPDLLKSGYYYKDDLPELKNKALPSDIGGILSYVPWVYSAEGIRQEGKLVPYSMTNVFDGVPRLVTSESKNIELIINKK